MTEKNFFSGMFDFNRDGRTDAIERAIGYQVLEEMEENEKGNQADKTELNEDEGEDS